MLSVSPGGRSEVSPAQLRRITLLAMSLTSWIGFYWLAEAAHAAERQQFDMRLRAAVHTWTQPVLTWLMLRATYLGSGPVLFTVSLLALIIFLYRRWHRMAILLLLNMVAVPWFTDYLKMSFHRVRPSPYFGIAAPGGFSFPSGHSFASFCCYGMMAALVSVRLRRGKTRVAMWIGAVLLIAIIGLSRVYLGVHYPSDVLGGWAAALAWISFVLIFDKRDEPTSSK